MLKYKFTTPPAERPGKFNKHFPTVEKLNPNFKIIKNYNPDIMLLQETYFSETTLNHLNQLCGGTWKFKNERGICFLYNTESIVLNQTIQDVKIDATEKKDTKTTADKTVSQETKT